MAIGGCGWTGLSDVDDVGEVREGVSEPAPAAESVDKGAGDPSASPRLCPTIVSDEAAPPVDPVKGIKARGDFSPLPPRPPLLVVMGTTPLLGC